MTAQTTYRRFTTTVTPDEFVITEIDPSTKHPFYSGSSDWYSARSREGAWTAARAQDKPVRFVGRDGKAVVYGVVFSAEAFERACYAGYVGYGQSMTDGYYAPLTFESWVVSFRRGPETDLRFGCDAADEVKAALPTYLAHLATV